jgi:hypothetical protein
MPSYSNGYRMRSTCNRSVKGLETTEASRTHMANKIPGVGYFEVAHYPIPAIR